jgi:putative Holliday junction resolvase
MVVDQAKQSPMPDPPSPVPRLVAVDYGTRRVGLAITDPLGLFAQPYGTFSPDAAVEAILSLHAEQRIARVVIGWPLTPEGDEGPATERVQHYINRLARRLPGVPIEKLDERGSSRRAVEALVEAGFGRKKRRNKARIDAASAVVLLQDFLGAD